MIIARTYHSKSAAMPNIAGVLGNSSKAVVSAEQATGTQKHTGFSRQMRNVGSSIFEDPSRARQVWGGRGINSGGSLY